MKFISPLSKPPEKIIHWVNKHLPDYSGPLNVQYRDDIIIEVSYDLHDEAVILKALVIVH